MFTGIIEEVGTVISAEGGVLHIGTRTVISAEGGVLHIGTRTLLDGTQLGDSIAMNGVDLTVRTMDEQSMTFDVMPETFRRSDLANLEPGSRVNLERSVRPTDRLSGHIVRGVVETVCTLDSLTPEDDAIIARYRVAPEFLRYIVMKGPVCVDGASLTVMARDEESFSVSLVQYTQQHTNLTYRKPGDSINLETDIIARYVEQLLEARAATSTGADS